MNKSIDVVVVGGGIAGLIAATKAARGGATTVLLDGHPVGGRARSVVRDGFTLNNGPHAVYKAGRLMGTLKDMGIALTGGPPVYKGAGTLFDGEVIPLPTGAGGLMRTKMLRPTSRVRAARLLATAQRIDPAPWAGRPLQSWLDTMPDDLAVLIHLLIRTASYVNAPDTLDAAAAIVQLQLALKGVLYVDGGWQRIVDELQAAAIGAGVDVRQSSAVRTVACTDGGVTMTSDEDEVRAAVAIVAAGSPELTARLVGSPIDGADRIGAAVEASVLDLGTSSVPQTPLLFGSVEPLYLSTHAPAARLAPEGMALVSLMHYITPGSSPVDVKAAQTELFHLGRRAGIEDGDIVLQRYLHRVTVSQGYPTAAGGGLAGRPTITGTGLGNVLIAGDWVGPHGLLADASAASAVEAATAALRTVHARRSSSPAGR